VVGWQDGSTLCRRDTRSIDIESKDEPAASVGFLAARFRACHSARILYPVLLLTLDAISAGAMLMLL